MYSKEEILKKNKKEIFDRFPITQIGIFGSYLAGEQNSDSDVDILIEYNKKKKFSIIHFLKLRTFLSEVLENKVDLVIKSKLKDAIGEQILNQVKYL